MPLLADYLNANSNVVARTKALFPFPLILVILQFNLSDPALSHLVHTALRGKERERERERKRESKRECGSESWPRVNQMKRKGMRMSIGQERRRKLVHCNVVKSPSFHHECSCLLPFPPHVIFHLQTQPLLFQEKTKTRMMTRR